MACDLTRGRKEPCKDVVGGLKAVYFTDFGDYGTVTQTDDEIKNLTNKIPFPIQELHNCNTRYFNVNILG